MIMVHVNNDPEQPMSRPVASTLRPLGRETLSDDKILRTLARHFLKDLVEILFPDVAGDIDFASAKFIGDKLFADFRKRGHVRPDVVVELRSKDGKPNVALFHAELEHQYLKVIEKRLKTYFHQLSLEYEDAPVLSAALFLHGGPKQGIEKREVLTQFQGYVTNRFYYMAFSLSRSLAEEYLKRPQNVAVALAALMRSEIWDRVEQKIRCYEAVQRADVDEEKRYLLANVVASYLQLDEEETARFHAEVRQEERQEVGKMIQTFSEALADREARGEARGMLQATRDAIILLARSIHKVLPKGFEEKLNGTANLDRLHQILEQVPKVRSLEEIVFESAH